MFPLTNVDACLQGVDKIIENFFKKLKKQIRNTCDFSAVQQKSCRCQQTCNECQGVTALIVFCHFFRF